jgi:hypothetical protein
MLKKKTQEGRERQHTPSPMLKKCFQNLHGCISGVIKITADFCTNNIFPPNREKEITFLCSHVGMVGNVLANKKKSQMEKMKGKAIKKELKSSEDLFSIKITKNENYPCFSFAADRKRIVLFARVTSIVI